MSEALFADMERKAKWCSSTTRLRILALIACVRAADSMRDSYGGLNELHKRHAYDAARRALEELP